LRLSNRFGSSTADRLRSVAGWSAGATLGRARNDRRRSNPPFHCLIWAGPVSTFSKGFKGDNADQDAGIAIVRRALQAPIRQIAENSGVEGSIVVGKILENSSATFGFNAQSEEYVDLITAGIIDPAKVVRTALQDAASVAGLMITTERPSSKPPRRVAAAPAAACPAAAWATWATWTSSPGSRDLHEILSEYGGGAARLRPFSFAKTGRVGDGYSGRGQDVRAVTTWTPQPARPGLRMPSVDERVSRRHPTGGGGGLSLQG
jgi:hypothetical protein